MPTFTGLQRSRRTSRAVRLGDRASRWIITIGGIATIGAVATVCLFLVWVVLPLLVGGSQDRVGAHTTPSLARVLAAEEDDYRKVAWTVRDDGVARLFATADGALIAEERLFDPTEVGSYRVHDDELLLGYRDGSIEKLRIRVSALVDSLQAAPVEIGSLPVGETLRVGPTLYERTSATTARRQALEVERNPRLSLGDRAVVDIDGAATPNGTMVAALTEDGRLHLKTEAKTENLLTGEVTTTLDGASLPIAELAPGLADSRPAHVLLAGAGDNVYLLWNDGRLVRIETRDLERPRLVEELRVLAEGRRVAAAQFLIGKSTLLVGDDRGEVTAWFRTKPAGATTLDGAVLRAGRTFAPAAASAVVDIHASRRSRLFAVAHADGGVRVLHGTSAREVVRMRAPEDEHLQVIRLTAKEDGVLALGSRGMTRWNLSPGHPEVTPATTFLPVWYEGYPGPAHVWQSTSGSDDFEPKFGLWSLIFGTLKATFYCLLFGVPLALLAAIYTSEFLHPRSKARIKPAIELMASLPSVVLGFLAALVFAPLVEEHLLALLLLLLTVPLVLLGGASLAERLPPTLRNTGDRWRVPGALLALPIGVLLAAAIAPPLERLLFDGSLCDWLVTDAVGNARSGSAFGGWLLLCLPIAVAAVLWQAPRLPRWTRHAVVRWLLGPVATLAVAAFLAGAVTAFGWDLRGSLVGTNDQRNSLVVGFVMGFAVIPIIYTIAEDALSSVPAHLRAASLGAGATPWQTAIRIVLPTALSGVFSAVMVGLGRAVGETMIVLMAAGNTPVLDLNVFNGFRTLSANIATELPEAVRDSTHYRMLYLAALCLFVVTFVLNTAAEAIRQRFRKRAYQL